MAKLKPKTVAELQEEKAEHELAAVQHQAWADTHEGSEHRARVALARLAAGDPREGMLEILAITNAKLQHHHQGQAWRHIRAAKRCREEIEGILG